MQLSRKPRPAVLLALLTIAQSAFAGRPLVTDDARLLDARTCQLETFHRHTTAGHDNGAVPGCNPFGNLELSAGVTRTSSAEPATTLTLQAKTLLRPLEADGWGAGLVVGTIDPLSPRGSRRLVSWYGTLPLSWSLANDRYLFHLNGGIEHDRLAQETRATWGLANETNLGSRVTLLAETFGRSGEKPYWQAGGRLGIVPDLVQVDFTVGRQFGGGSDTRWWNIGLRLQTPPLW